LLDEINMLNYSPPNWSTDILVDLPVFTLVNQRLVAAYAAREMVSRGVWICVLVANDLSCSYL
jgi:hypothetical protein